MRLPPLFLAVVSVTLCTVTESIAHADILPPGTVDTCTYDNVCTAGSECVYCFRASYVTASSSDSGKSDGSYANVDECDILEIYAFLYGFTSTCSRRAGSGIGSIWCRRVLPTKDEDSGTSSSDDRDPFADAYRCPDNGVRDASIKTDAAVRDASANLDAAIRDIGTKLESTKEKNNAKSDAESEDTGTTQRSHKRGHGVCNISTLASDKPSIGPGVLILVCMLLFAIRCRGPRKCQ